MDDPERMADAVVQAIQMATAPLHARIAALEARPTLKFCGIYSDTKAYAPGDCATRQGGLWACKTATTGPFDHAAWQLAVKKGDAR